MAARYSAWITALALALIGLTAGHAHADTQLDAIGMPVTPAYIHAREIDPSGRTRLKTAAEQQSRSRHSTRPFRLDPRQGYLWVVSHDGSVHVAPIKKYADGTESVGHPMLNGGRPARLGGELNFRDGRWVMDNDSGRFSHFNPDIQRANLESAHQLVAGIGLADKGGKKIQARLRYLLPWGRRPDLGKKDAVNLRRAMLFRKLGGYFIKGDARAGQPRSPAARARWRRAAVKTLGKGGTTPAFVSNPTFKRKAMNAHKRQRNRTSAARHGAARNKRNRRSAVPRSARR